MRPKKNLGQNFLIDDNIVTKIATVIPANENDLIIEIGPGMGVLTKKLKLKNSFIVGYEIDTDFKIYLNKLIDNKTKIIYEDILKSNIKEDIKDISYHHLYIVGNLPYYITTPIIKYLINSGLDIKEMIFMVQKEVALRYTATSNHHEYSSISLYLQYFYNITKLFAVSKNAFYPIPKVESAVIKMVKRIDRPNVEQDKYFKLINDAFHLKRKTLKNNLKDYDSKKIDDILQKYHLNGMIRAEELSEEVFIDLYNSLFK